MDRDGENDTDDAEEAERQRRSFAYGNVKIENDSITWEIF